MYYTNDELKKDGWTLIKANTIAAASLYVCKDKARPVIQNILVEVDKDGTSATATDSYKLGHFVSMDPGINEPGRFMLKWEAMRAAKLIPASPKKSLWVAVKRTCDERNFPVINLMTLDYSGVAYTKVGELTFDECEGNFPKWQQLDGRADYMKNPGTKAGKDKVVANPNESPGLNTSYLIDIFKSIEKAVSNDGEAVTQILHRHLIEPMYLMAHNKSGESALAMCMPVRM